MVLLVVPHYDRNPMVVAIRERYDEALRLLAERGVKDASQRESRLG